ncbi:non-ribosomal peptide synthetase [Aspergillus sclerotialis]|uniref:Non-ribosomal peptide synthetase n=1 Tax=Aspergillus sclerotialis TaxID=2070753 RepID=A0A3A2ZJG4_9EURO|nr:non-ribosomal peptide synthetase [Aspergillus sclerotialis]
MTRHIEALVDTVQMCISNPDATIKDCLRPTTSDLNNIWNWNHILPPSYNFCMHEMISEQAQKFPHKEAISSWDGSLTYAQIEQYSISVALLLKDMGVELHDVLPVCFEKSKWVVVAVLGAMKAGATFVLMDPTLPLARLQNMAEQVGAKMMLISSKQRDLSKSIMPSGKHIVVEEDTFAHPSDSRATQKLAAVPPSALMYLIFTSGSTGTPKGVKISHDTYTSSAVPRAKAVGYTEKSRVLDFASYAFDVSIDSMLLTLGNGGCLCIPSDEDRLNDINEVIRKMRVNYAGLTPSVARILDPDVIASLSGLGLGGEAVSARDVAHWGKDARIIIGYGPCECTIGCTINSSAATGRNYISIGRGNGAAIWIADPSDHELLLPVGAVGEILVEGPIVGQGYLNDPDKTAAAFIEDPPWLTAGHNGYIGRRGRLYKTGDLGKYDPDGSGGLVFAGRKDTQVKLRGQRVELGEIESQLRARLPEADLIAEVIVPKGSRGQPTLVVFVVSQSAKRHDHSELVLGQISSELRGVLSKINADIAKVLPRYMVPTAYIPINFIPILISGKTDRKRLRELGATVDLRQLDEDTARITPRHLSDLEHRLRQAWGQTLKFDSEGICPTDNFFSLGGDSLAAMRLVSICRAHGLDLSVSSIFCHPTLSDMASVVQICNSKTHLEIPSFSMIYQPVESVCLEASHACGLNREAVEDIYPCTPTQESLFTFSLKSVKAYVAQRVACIPLHISLDAWKRAWDDVVAASPILRTRLVPLQEPGLQQVVLKEGIHWRYSTDLAEYLESDRNEKMNLGQSLARYAIVTPPNNNLCYMVWTVHHVLYDGWSEPLILKKVGNALQGQQVETQSQIRDFVKYVRGTDENAMHEFWRRELKGAVGPQFPRLPSRDYLPNPDVMIERQVPFDIRSALPFTMATVIRGAWALVASQYTGSDDVVFGETLTGRDIPLPGVEGIVGPLIATLPVRIHIHRGLSVESYLHTVQRSMLARIPYQHMGMQNIRKVSRDAQHACEAGTGLVIQPEPEYVGSDLGFYQGDAVREALNFNPYPLMLACGIGKDGFRVCASFDSGLIDTSQMDRILGQLEMACLQLTKDFSRKVGEISCLPEAELNQIWQWNYIPPLALDDSSKTLRADSQTKHGSIYPPAVVPWVCNLRNSSLLSPIGCVGELCLEGALTAGETIETPTWLMAGSSSYAGRMGKVQLTGDMVQLQGDGKLIFVGRKENVVAVQGHEVDIADLESYFTKYLPETVRSAAAVFQPHHGSSPGTFTERDLVIFVEQQPFLEDGVEVMSADHHITCDSSDPHNVGTTICAAISNSLSEELKRLDKFMHDSLPSYMVPSAYVVVERLPTEMGQISHSLLNQLALNIPQKTLTKIREGFKIAWEKGLAQREFSVAENILRSSWAKILRLNPEQIDVDDNFFRLGGDSVLAMRLVSKLRVQGHSLTVADIFQHMRLCDAARVLKVGQVSNEKVQPYKPFSTLGHFDIEKFLSEIVRPKLANPGWSIRDVSPVTDSQDLDIKATIRAPRTSIQYTILYLDRWIDRERLLRSCKDLVQTHEILRTVFIEYESVFLQVVLDDIDVPVIKKQADGELEEYVTAIWTSHIETKFDLGTSFLKMFHIEGNGGQECLVIGLSHAQYDGFSLPRLLRDLETLYIGQKIIDFEPFSSYMARISDERMQTKALNYWRDLLKGSSLSVIAGKSVQPTDRSIFQTKPTGISKAPEGITTANLLTAAWALVLARRLEKPDVTFGSVTSGRNIDLANVENVMGPCYHITPIRVPFNPQWTTMDLVRFVQKQSVESAAHDFLGFDKISKHCTQWPSELPFFDSMVHHQDFEDFDYMPFAGGTCKVEIVNPHGDAAYPLKAVSLVQDGQIHVGVVGSEKDQVIVDHVLNSLAAAVQELASCESQHSLLDEKVFKLVP